MEKESKCDLLDKSMPLVSRKWAEFVVGDKDCGERLFEPDEKEDLIRTFIYGASVQRDKDYHDALPKIIETHIEAEIERIETELAFAWNEESIRNRNQSSTTLPIWVRSGLGLDITDKRTTRLKRKAKVTTGKQKINGQILEQVVNAMYEAQSARKATRNILELTNANCQARIETLIGEIEKISGAIIEWNNGTIYIKEHQDG